MFPALIEKLRRQEDLTTTEAADGDGGDHARRGGAGADRRTAGRPRHEGRAADRAGGLRADHARERGADPGAAGRRVRHLRHRRRSIGHLQHLHGVGDRGGGVRHARGEARQPIGVEPMRQRRRARGAGRQHSGHRRHRRRVPERSRHRVPLRADVSSGDEACGAGAQGSRRAHGVQPARPADQSGPAGAADRRRAAARADGAARAFAVAARVGARVGGARRRRSRRALDDGLHEGVGVQGHLGADVLRASGRLRSGEGHARIAEGWRCGDQREDRRGGA